MLRYLARITSGNLDLEPARSDFNSTADVVVSWLARKAEQARHRWFAADSDKLEVTAGRTCPDSRTRASDREFETRH
ncbi:hypothetical protein ACVIHF_008716 [Bradyrhizobium sp. USDA 4506]